MVFILIIKKWLWFSYFVNIHIFAHELFPFYFLLSKLGKNVFSLSFIATKEALYSSPFLYASLFFLIRAFFFFFLYLNSFFFLPLLTSLWFQQAMDETLLLVSVLLMMISFLVFLILVIFLLLVVKLAHVQMTCWTV